MKLTRTKNNSIFVKSYFDMFGFICEVVLENVKVFVKLYSESSIVKHTVLFYAECSLKMAFPYYFQTRKQIITNTCNTKYMDIRVKVVSEFHKELMNVGDK